MAGLLKYRSSPERAIIEDTVNIDPLSLYIQDKMNKTLTNITPNKSDEYIYGEYQAGEPLEERHEPETFKKLKRNGFFNDDVKIIHSLADGNCFLHSIKILSPNVNRDPDKKSCDPQYIEDIKGKIRNLSIQQEYTDADLERFFNKSGEYFDDMAISLYLKLHFGISGLNIKFLIIINSSEGEAQNISIIKSNKGSDSNEDKLKNEIIRPDQANPDKTYDYINYGILILHREPGKQPHYNAIPYKINDEFINIINKKIKEIGFNNPRGLSEDLVASQLDIPINDLRSVQTSPSSSQQSSPPLPPPPPTPPTPPLQLSSPTSSLKQEQEQEQEQEEEQEQEPEPKPKPKQEQEQEQKPVNQEQDLSITTIIDDLNNINTRFDKINQEHQNISGNETIIVANYDLDNEMIITNINGLKEDIENLLNLVSPINQ